MEKQIKIPKGWRRLRKGTTIKKGDKFWSYSWLDANSVGTKVGFIVVLKKPLIYIRKTNDNQRTNKKSKRIN